MVKSRFDQTVDEAVDEIARTGFVSAERLAYWEERIRRAAVEERPGARMEDVLRDFLARTYEKMLARGVDPKLHKGIPRWTLEKVRPELRANLDRRILASANLIRLNKRKRVEETLQRFSGWSTSIPAGGSAEPEKRETKARIKKPIASLPFEERRVLIDQGHKLFSSLNEVVAVGGGAIAAVWHSRWRQPNYNYREDHKDRDQIVYLVPGSWAVEAGLIKAGPDGKTDGITKPAEEPFCFPGDSKIPYAGLIEKAFRRSYSGELVTFVTASNKTLRSTLNHPILTPTGWCAAGSLKEGDYVIEVADHLLAPFEENENDRVPILSEIFAALSKNGIVRSPNERAANFHGDIADGNVDTVGAARGLLIDYVTTRTKRISKFLLAMTKVAGAAFSAANFGYHFLLFSSKRITGCFCKGLSSFNTFPLHSYEAGIGTGASSHANFEQALFKHPPADSGSFRNRQDAFTSDMRVAYGLNIERRSRWSAFETFAKVKAKFSSLFPKMLRPEVHDFSNGPYGLPFVTKATKLVKIERSRSTAHVYNLQTKNGWYVVNGILAHNCRCSYAYVYSLRELDKLAPDMLTVKGRAALDDARAKLKAMS